MKYLNLKAFKKSSLLFIHRIISNKDLLLSDKLYTVYFDDKLYYKKVVLIYKDITLQQKNFMTFLCNKEVLIYTTEVFYEKTNVCLKATFNVPIDQEMIIHLFSECGTFALNPNIMLEISSYWKNFSHLIFEYEKTQTARESSLGYFYFFSCII